MGFFAALLGAIVLLGLIVTYLHLTGPAAPH
jgi:hypothetical protein